jgi:CSLREA domain-containing protein
MGLRSRWELAGIGRGALLALLVCVLVLVAHPSSVRADGTVTVTTTTDETTTGDGTCSLREAILYANGTAETDCGPGATGTTTIVVPAGHYVLSQGALPITGNAVIQGQGASGTIIDAGGGSQVVSVGAASQSTLSGVTITGGTSGHVPCSGFFCLFIARNGAPGGGIVNAGSVQLVNSIVSGNVASSGTAGLVVCDADGSCAGASPAAGGAGGGIDNTGTLGIADSTITNNTTEGADGGAASPATSSGAGAAGGAGGASGAGGGIASTGTLTITDSAVSGNATGRGGNGGPGADGNGTGAGGAGGAGATAGAGGGIENTGSLTIKGTTISSNRTGAGGAGGNGGAGAGGPAGGGAGAGAAGGTGGGIDSTTGIVVQNSTFTGNATGSGGAAGTPGSPGGATAAAGTPGSGGGLNQSAAGASLSQDTIAANNSAGTAGGLDASGGQITYSNSIIASNRGGTTLSNCAGAMVTDEGNNVVFGDATCNRPEGPNPNLGQLADNGGPTQTMALLAGSSAVDLVPVNACPLTTDQRGVSRPQGSACDSGAYELAPPSVSGAAGKANATTAASVTASVNPHFKDTHVSLVYGTTTAYGSTAPTEDLGAGNSGLPYSATLGGLTPNTTYHAQLTATNADGTTKTGDLSFTTPASVTAVLGQPSTTGPMILLPVSCTHGNATDVCQGPIVVTTHETVVKGAPVALASAGTNKKPVKPKRKPAKRTTKKITVARTSYRLNTGQKTTLKLTLNSAGKKLLNRFYRVPATLSIGGTSPITKSITFSYGRLHISPSFTWAFGKSFSFATELTLGGLPKKSKVALICRGHGCPFSKRTFSAPKHGKLLLAPALKQRHLSPHATVELDITAPNDVGEVVVFTVVSGKQPTEAFRCLVPGARTPTACVS